MKTTLVLSGFILALLQCHVPAQQQKPGLLLLHSGRTHFHGLFCQPTDACIGNGGYCIRNSKREDCDGLLFPKECRSHFCSCCVQVKQDECAAGNDNCPANSECQDKEIGYKCACNAGFEQCGDINECDSDPCGPGMRCQNTPGSYDCVCDAGFEKVDGTCVDINECTSATNPCGPNSVCSNSPPGSFSCNCNAGYVFRDGTCVDNNECDSNPCPANSLCQNTDGSYQCTCATGFTNQTGSCVDINECNSSPPPCSDLQMCINTSGSYSCACQKCSPRCERGGVLVSNSFCASVIHLPSSPMTWDEASLRCGTLAPPGQQEYLNELGSLFLSDTEEGAWIDGAEITAEVYTDCPVIRRDGTSFTSTFDSCDSKYPSAICLVPRLW